MSASPKTQLSRIGLVLLASLAFTRDAGAQQEATGGLSQILQGLQWGASHDAVLEHYQALSLEDYRAEIAGMRDALQIDEVRRAHDQRYQRVASSYEVFDGARTGYEVSVLGGEVAAANDESMLTVRTNNAILYYVFYADQLFKIVVAYNSAYLGGLEFESFLDQVEARYGPAEATAVDETATGVRYLARATWDDGSARLRVENRSNLFGTFVMVFTDPTLEDRAVATRGYSGEPSNRVQVSDRVRMLSERRGSGAGDDIADQIIGSPTVVELQVPEAAPLDIVTPAEARPMATEGSTEGSAEADETQASDEEAEEDTREQRRQREHEEREAREEEEEEGITIY